MLFCNLFRFICIWLLLLACVQESYAQKITLTGTVTDRKTNLPVEGVGVKLSSTGAGISTNKAGTFSSKTDSILKQDFLIFSHLNYLPFSLEIKPGQREFSVTLIPKINTLSEVKIIAAKKLKPAKIRPETTLDYAIIGNRLFVLNWQKNRRNPTLQVLNAANDSVILNCHLPVYAEKLYVDCLQNLHVLTETAAHQVLFDSVATSLFPAIPMAEFEQYIKPCLVAKDENLYFRNARNNGITTAFYAVNQQTALSTLLQTIQDEEVLTMQQDEARYQKSKAMAGMNRNSQSAAQNSAFAQKFLFRGTYLPLFKIGKEICLFDHLNNKVGFYSQDSLTHNLPVKYHLQKDWVKEIIVDNAQAKAYPVFVRNGLYILKKLNLETGELENSFKIPNAFASKISVHNETVYFLYKDPAKSMRQFLYKSPLKILEE